jgi:uncharacterized NAD(P)/FAD-binding protein YdhS
MTLQFSYGLRRFGGLEYVPRIIVLSAVRELGPQSALFVTCGAAVIVVHRASRDSGAPVNTSDSPMALSTAALCVINVAAAVIGGLGVAAAALDVVLVMFALPRLLQVVAASRRGLVVKLIATWLAVGAVGWSTTVLFTGIGL